MTTAYHGWFHCLYLSISTSFRGVSDDGFGSDDADEDDGASLLSDDEMSTWRCKHKFFPIVENQTIEKKYGLQIIICIDV